MTSLLLKEYYSNRSVLLIAAAMLFIFPLVFFQDNASGPSTPVIFSAVMALYFTMGVNMEDRKNDSDVLLNSLPVTRRQIVTAKYVAAVLVGALFIAIGKTVSMIKAQPTVSLTEAAVALIAVVLFSAVYFPLFYKFGTQFVIFAIVVLTILFFTALPIVFYTGMKSGFWGLAGLWQQHRPWLLIALFILTVAAVLFSCSFSVRLYEKKEF